MDSYGDTSGRIGRDWLDRHDEELEQELLDDEPEPGRACSVPSRRMRPAN